jgi:hypothetical protein
MFNIGYFYEDILYIAGNILLLLFLFGYKVYSGRLARGSFMLLSLILLLSTAGLSDMAFRWNPNPNVVLLAAALNVFCFVAALSILLHFSMIYFHPTKFWKNVIFCSVYYFPVLVITGFQLFSPLLISGIITGPVGFRLVYNPAYLIIVLYAAALVLLTVLFNLATIVRDPHFEKKNQSAFLLFILLLVVYFYSASLVLPFLFGTVNFASPLPTTFAVLILAYTYIRYNYFTTRHYLE